MANVKYATGFPPASALNLTDHLQVVQGALDKDATIQQLLNLFSYNLVNYYNIQSATTHDIPNPIGNGLIGFYLEMTDPDQAFRLPAMNTANSARVGSILIITNASGAAEEFALETSGGGTLFPVFQVGQVVILRLIDNSTAAGTFETLYDSSAQASINDLTSYQAISQAATYDIPNPLGYGIIGLRLTMTNASQTYRLPPMDETSSIPLGTYLVIVNPSSGSNTFQLETADNIILDVFQPGQVSIFQLMNNGTAGGFFQTIYNSAAFATNTLSNVSAATIRSAAGFNAVNIVGGTTYTVTATDVAAAANITSNVAGITITVDNSFAVGDSAKYIQGTSGQVTFVADGGVSLNSPLGNLKIAFRYGQAVLTKTAGNVYYLSGDLSS